MSPSSPSPPPPHPLPPLTLTSSLCFTLTWWSSHLCRCILQVLLHHALRQTRALARRPPMTPLALRHARVRRRRPPVLHLPLRPTRVWGRQLPRLLRVSPSRCTSTSVVRGRLCCFNHHWWPLLRQRRLHHRWPLLRRRRLHHRRGPQLPVSCRRCTTHCSFTDTRVMFTLW